MTGYRRVLVPYPAGRYTSAGSVPPSEGDGQVTGTVLGATEACAIEPGDRRGRRCPRRVSAACAIDAPTISKTANETAGVRKPISVAGSEYGQR
jgi:hypothetical protein